MTTAGNLVFQGRADGNFVAHDARTGAELWRANLGLGISAPPITYTVNGRQYVALLVGWGGSMAALGGRPGRARMGIRGAAPAAGGVLPPGNRGVAAFSRAAVGHSTGRQGIRRRLGARRGGKHRVWWDVRRLPRPERHLRRCGARPARLRGRAFGDGIRRRGSWRIAGRERHAAIQAPVGRAVVEAASFHPATRRSRAGVTAEVAPSIVSAFTA